MKLVFLITVMSLGVSLAMDDPSKRYVYGQPITSPSSSTQTSSSIKFYIKVYDEKRKKDKKYTLMVSPHILSYFITLKNNHEFYSDYSYKRKYSLFPQDFDAQVMATLQKLMNEIPQQSSPKKLAGIFFTKLCNQRSKFCVEELWRLVNAANFLNCIPLLKATSKLLANNLFSTYLKTFSKNSKKWKLFLKYIDHVSIPCELSLVVAQEILKRARTQDFLLKHIELDAYTLTREYRQVAWNSDETALYATYSRKESHNRDYENGIDLVRIPEGTKICTFIVPHRGENAIRSIAIHPHNELFAISSFGKVYIFNITSLRPIKELSKADDECYHLSWNSEGNHLIVLGWETVNIWNVHYANLEKVFSVPSDCFCIALSENGKKVALFDLSKKVSLVDLSSNKRSKVIIDDPKGLIYSCAQEWLMQGDYKKLSEIDGSNLWDSHLHFLIEQPPLISLAWQKNYLLVSEGQTVKIWNIKRKHFIREFGTSDLHFSEYSSVSKVSWSPQGNYITIRPFRGSHIFYKWPLKELRAILKKATLKEAFCIIRMVENLQLNIRSSVEEFKSFSDTNFNENILNFFIQRKLFKDETLNNQS